MSWGAVEGEDFTQVFIKITHEKINCLDPNPRRICFLGLQILAKITKAIYSVIRDEIVIKILYNSWAELRVRRRGGGSAR